MPERKAWTSEEDQLLKHLREEAKINKWSIIAKKMADEHNMPGRTGKQCRQRYHNHLDSRITRAEWTKQQQQNLYDLHDQIGNKWAIIAQKLTGRTDNCVKNHFYSRMRKAIRKLNKTIQAHLKKQYKQVKMQTLYKIVEATDEKFKNVDSADNEVSEKCCKIKNLLLAYSSDDNPELDNDIETLKLLFHDIQEFGIKYKCKQKRERRNSQDEGFLQVPKFTHKVRSSERGSDDESEDEYSRTFSKSYDADDDSDNEDSEIQYSAVSKVSNRKKIESEKKVSEKKESEKKVSEKKVSEKGQKKMQLAAQVTNGSGSALKPPVLSIKIPVIFPKCSLNMQQDPEKLQQLLKNEGILQNSVTMTKNNGQVARVSTLRRDDSYGIIFEGGSGDNKLHSSLLGDSLQLHKHPQINIHSNLNFSVELDEDHKLFR